MARAADGQDLLALVLDFDTTHGFTQMTGTVVELVHSVFLTVVELRYSSNAMERYGSALRRKKMTWSTGNYQAIRT
jgi:hypothetical protein